MRWRVLGILAQGLAQGRFRGGWGGWGGGPAGRNSAQWTTAAVPVALGLRLLRGGAGSLISTQHLSWEGVSESQLTSLL